MTRAHPQLYPFGICFTTLEPGSLSSHRTAYIDESALCATECGRRQQRLNRTRAKSSSPSARHALGRTSTLTRVKPRQPMLNVVSAGHDLSTPPMLTVCN